MDNLGIIYIKGIFYEDGKKYEYNIKGNKYNYYKYWRICAGSYHVKNSIWIGSIRLTDCQGVKPYRFVKSES